MRERTHWSDLRVGLIGAAVIAALVVFILLFARVGEMHGDKVTLYVVTSDATGVLKGTDIWLAGQKIGQVEAVRFRPVTSDTSERIVIEAEILAERLSPIRRDTRAQIRPGKSMIGVPVVYLSGGSVGFPGLHSGDTIRSVTSTAVTDLGADMSSAAKDVRGLASEARTLAGNLSGTRGTVGAMRARGIPGMASMGREMSSLDAHLSSGGGTLGLAMRGNLGARASRVMAGIDSIQLLMSSDRGNIGRFRKDTTLVTMIGGIRAEVDSLWMLASDPVGTIARNHSDSVLVRDLARARAHLDTLMRDVKRHPLKYISP